MRTRHQHPIRVVASRTGLSPHRIRMWEKRYGAVRPERTATRRRLYSDEDLERLDLLRRATERDRTIGQVVGLSNAELRTLIAEDAMASTQRPHLPANSEGVGELHGECMRAVRELDEDRLSATLSRAEVVLSDAVLIERLIVPFMTEIGDLWRAGSIRIMHEHMASAVIRSFLVRLMRAHRPERDAPRLVIATPADQRHELGALVVAATAASEGWRTLYLGTDVPSREIAAAAIQAGATGVALSLSHLDSDAGSFESVQHVRELLPAELEVLVGGAGARALGGRCEAIGVRVLEGVEALRLHLRAKIAEA